MDIEIRHRNEFYICGYAVETTLENNDADISRLYGSFFGTDKERSLPGLPGCGQGYYGLEWYTEGHKSFFYLLGREVSGDCGAHEGALLKSIPPAEYAVARFPAGSSLIEAWTEFFNSVIPAAGYAPDEKHGFYFEYYPEDVRGAFELWTPVKKRHIDFEIRPVKPFDYKALTALSFASKRYWDYPDSYFDIWKNELTITPEYIEKNKVFAAVRDNAMIGYFSVAEVKEGFYSGSVFVDKGFWLEHFFIAPEYIRKGAGSKLMEYAVSWCRENGIKSLRIFSDPNAAGFYEKQGAKFLYDSASSIAGRTVPVYEIMTG